MIGSLRGKIVSKQPPGLILEVQGVGYELEVSMNTFYSLPETGAEVRLLTHLTVRDDAHLLFGFADEDERHVFRALIKVSGVGAKLALAILSGIEAGDFKRCIKAGDTARLTRLPGIGKKTAERLLVEMRDRLGDWQTTAAGDGLGPRRQTDDPLHEATSALIALGYRPQEASRLLQTATGATEGLDSEALIREALKTAAKGP